MDPHSFIARAEAQRWLGIAEKLLMGHDLVGSKTFAIRARESDPRLEAADQILAINDTLLAAEKRVVGSNGNQQPDYYAILQLVRFVQDTEHIAAQYRRLAIMLNPHQNRFPYSDQAFQLVNDAWAVLSNPMRKSIYDAELDFPPQQQMNPIGFNLEQQHHQQHHHQHQQQQQQQHNFFSINHMGSGHEQELLEPQQTFQNRVQRSHQQQLQQHNFLSQNPVRPVPVGGEQEQLFQHREQEQLFQPQVQPFQVTSAPQQQTRPPPQPPQPQPPMQPPTPPPPAAPPQPPLSWPQAPPLSQPPPQQKHQQQQHSEPQLQQQQPPPPQQQQLPPQQKQLPPQQKQQQQQHSEPQPQPQQQQHVQQKQLLQQEQQHHHHEQQESLEQNANAAPVRLSSQVNSNNGVREEERETEAETEAAAETENFDNSPTFWTACPYCFYMYEYPRLYADCTLRCDNCKRAFQAVRISSPPPTIEGQEAYFYCWGFFPLGVSMSHLQKNKGTGTNSSWTPFSPLSDVSRNVQDHLNGRAAPKKNIFGNKNSGPRIYVDDDVADDIFVGISDPSDDSDVEWNGTREKKVKKMKKGLKPDNKKRAEVIAVRVRDSTSGCDKNLQPGQETSKKAVGTKDLGKLDLNVEFNNNEGGEDPAPRMTAGNRGNGQGEEDNIEGIGFFEGLDEFLSSLPILSVVNDEKVKAA